jgi:hypothetical protein
MLETLEKIDSECAHRSPNNENHHAQPAYAVVKLSKTIEITKARIISTNVKMRRMNLSPGSMSQSISDDRIGIAVSQWLKPDYPHEISSAAPARKGEIH